MDVYFDLDGTLTDPKPGITRSIQYALTRLDRPAPSEDELTWCIGPPLQASFRTLLGRDDLAERAVVLYRERFVDIGMFENSVYPGVVEVLAALTGRRLFVATSKPLVYAARIIAHFGLDVHFEQVFGAELDGTRADKTDLLDFALKAAGVDPTRAIMVGDRRHDMVGARNNAMAAIGVLYGYGSEAELVAAGAQHLCGSPAEIIAALGAVTANK